MVIRMHNLDKAELRYSLQKAKQASDYQGKLFYNKIILMNKRENKTAQKTQQIIK